MGQADGHTFFVYTIQIWVKLNGMKNHRFFLCFPFFIIRLNLHVIVKQSIHGSPECKQ